MTIVTISTVDSTLRRVKTIQVKPGTKRELDMVGRKGETYDAIIRKLIANYKPAQADGAEKRLGE